MQRNLCERVIKLDKNIRFAGIVNANGEVIEGGFQQGIQPLLNGPAEQQMYIQSLSNVVTLKQYADRLGAFRYSITEHDKVTLLTFPLGDGILCVSASSKADSAKIRNKVSALLKEKPRHSKKV
ncbi:DUF6659 family protein [Nitrososphaera viennensis]|uniref:Roadblock/LAMTOR2 domain-containing protein n=2 Tax=Nitrososphaera viennensis TaxID=1034015 RepID=A0A060HG30_9ARCH|nr:DUF6659 family protein [Nitrososphaera viennensis]AIC14548.1 hypothetical protein NVIE_003560 [Nitrososphaera viennensis EN76]UVS69519.1 hypothetical protein NWT39_01735 [Nitrososphaera viennensis]